MTFQEAYEGQTISKAEAAREMEKHGQHIDEYIAEYGDHETYDSGDILRWLGY